MKAGLRLFVSAIIAFTFYAAWAYYANSLVSDNTQVLVKAAVVQGSYSAVITLFFSVLIEFFNKIFSNKVFCLPLIVPTVVAPRLFSKKCTTTTTFTSTLKSVEDACKGSCIPGMLITPLPALLVQSILVISINIVFATPNLWLTVAPSIFFSAIYGYIYSIALTRKLAGSMPED